MKNLKYFLLLVVAMVAGTLIIGCSSDDYMGEAQQQGISNYSRRQRQDAEVDYLY